MDICKTEPSLVLILLHPQGIKTRKQACKDCFPQHRK